MKSIIITDAERLRDTIHNGVDEEQFNKAVDMINKGRRIYILGVRSSASIASFAAFYMGFLYDVVLVDTSATSEMIITMMSSDVPWRMVTSIKRLQSHTINRPSDTRPIPAAIRNSISTRMPFVLRKSQMTYSFTLSPFHFLTFHFLLYEPQLFPFVEDAGNISEGL